MPSGLSMLQVLRDLPENDPRQGLRGSCRVALDCATTRRAHECRRPGSIELAARCGARRPLGPGCRNASPAALISEDDELTQFDPEVARQVRRRLAQRGRPGLEFRASLGPRFARFVAGKLRCSMSSISCGACLLARDGVGDDPEALVRRPRSSPVGLTPRAFKVSSCEPGGCRDVIALAGRRVHRRNWKKASGLRNGQSEARDWAFLAMAHARQGRVDEAMRWLERLATFKVPDIAG